MTLKEYKKKRDLKKSKEPAAKIPKNKSSKLKYSIQEHNASHLHWDLRLEKNKVLKSWAIPKSPPTTKSVKRLAIQTEDHPLAYWNFKGEIKEGYGKGKVKIWDKGYYEIIEWSKKKIEIKISGKKLKGNYVLVKTNYGKTKEQQKKSWLFFKVD
jgi:DNA ligase D-like protein (predicted 3'-phosphoesterase)